MYDIMEMSGAVQQNSVIIIDGMAVVNEIINDVSMKTCKVRSFSNPSDLRQYAFLEHISRLSCNH